MPTCIFEAFERTARSRPDAPALRTKSNGGWQSLVWRDYHRQTRRAARALIALGLEPGDHTAILGANRPEWFMTDLATIGAGGVPTGIYATSTPEQCQYIASHCEARVIFIDTAEQLAKFSAVRSRLPQLRAIVQMHGSPDQREALSWDAFLALGESVSDERLDARVAAQRVDDVCTLVYTSGTTGVPKAVMLTHRNVSWQVEQVGAIVDVRAGEEMLSYLPLSHVAEQLFSLRSNVILGTCVSFAESLETLGETLRDTRPHHFLAVPRVWEKIQAKMQDAGAASPPLRRRIAAWARGVGLAGGYAVQRGARRPLLYPVADQLVFAKVRRALGLDRARTLISGAAPISRSTLEFFLSLGMPICDVYGMSETTAAATVNLPDRLRTGRAGRAIPGSEVRIADDGEICIRGPHVFAGYYKDPVATREMLDDDGWLHTGDVGELDADGFLAITDRKKELIITAGGENIAPQHVEGELKSIPVVNQAVVVGDRRRYLSALLTLDAEKLPAVAQAEGSPARNAEEAAQCPRFVAHLQREIEAVNRRLARVQTVKRFAVLPRELSIDGGELTPTLKLRRKTIAEKYAREIERLYE
jgi:long-subunit acyl-CoA synthetase (AMP-forming)